jgi:hypothetical protein
VLVLVRQGKPLRKWAQAQVGRLLPLLLVLWRLSVLPQSGRRQDVQRKDLLRLLWRSALNLLLRLNLKQLQWLYRLFLSRLALKDL